MYCNWKFKIEVKKNENTIYQHVWDAAKVVLREQFVALNVYVKKGERSKINDRSVHLRKLEKEQIKPNVSRRKE